MMKRSTQVPNTLFDLYLPHLKESELKILLIIIRQTNGWINLKTGKRKTRDRISRSQFVNKTGLSSKAVSTALQSLANKRMIRISDTKGNSLPGSSTRQGRSYLFYSLLFQDTSDSYRRSYRVASVGQVI